MDLARVRPVFEESGPFVSLHLEVGRTDENGVEQQESRWTNARHELEHAGVEPALVQEIGERVLENTHVPGDVRRTIVANSSGILFDDVQPGRSHHPEVIEVSELPELAGWLAHEDQGLRFVLAVVDRKGADIDVHRALGAPPVAQENVTQDHFYITKVHAGGWSDRHYDEDVEENWKQHAKEVSEAVHGLARRFAPRAVLVAGEVRARSDVLTALEKDGTQELGSVIEVKSGGRAEGASQDTLWEEVSEHLRTISAERESDVAAALDEARGRGEGAASGLDEVLEALAKSQVELLVLDPAAVEDEAVAPGKHPGMPLPEPAASADEVRADRALVAAAALTGAGITLMPDTMSGGGGVSALLRWSDNAGPEPTESA